MCMTGELDRCVETVPGLQGMPTLEKTTTIGFLWHLRSTQQKILSNITTKKAQLQSN